MISLTAEPVQDFNLEEVERTYKGEPRRVALLQERTGLEESAPPEHLKERRLTSRAALNQLHREAFLLWLLHE